MKNDDGRGKKENHEKSFVTLKAKRVDHEDVAIASQQCSI